MPNLTEEQKLLFVRGLFSLRDEEVLEALDTLAGSELWEKIAQKMIEAAHNLRDLEDNEIIDVMLGTGKKSIESWYKLLFPNKQKSIISCSYPNNVHTIAVSDFYECSGGSRLHYFCLNHYFNNTRCPIHNQQLTLTN